MTTLPSTLYEWKRYRDGSTTPFWETLRPFFEEHGYILWYDGGGFARPRDDPKAIRAPDEYHRWIPYIGPEESGMPIVRQVLFPARTTERKDVLIRLVVKGDQGHEHLRILETLNQADTEGKHILPLLELLRKDDMNFAVFPLVGTASHGQWYSDLAEVFDYLKQLFEAFAFLHSHHIAHWDFGSGEVLVNWAGNRWGIPKGDGSGELVDLPPWRKTFDVKYWLTDFELSVQYAADSDPSTHLVQGVPIAVWGLTDQDYLKQLAPEALKPEPYCPFKSDVYQMGFCSLEIFCLCEHPDLIDLLCAMMEENPADRPPFDVAVAWLAEIRAATSAEALQAPVERAYCLRWATHITTETQEATERERVARTQALRDVQRRLRSARTGLADI